MKSNAIARIVIYSLLLIVLVGLLGGLLLVSRYSYRSSDPAYVTPSASNTADAPPTVTQYDYTSPYADPVTQLEIDWAAGTITIQSGDTEQILFSESGNIPEGEKLVCSQKGSKLIIQYQKSSAYFGIHSTQPKDLTITVPRDWAGQSIEIDAAAAQLELRDITVQELDFEGATGTGTLENCTIGELDISTVSGDISFNGSLEVLEYEGVSAKLIALLSSSPRIMELESISGDLNLTLPETCGFTLSLDAMSGDFHSDFAVQKNKDTYTSGDGSCRIKVSGVSGDISIQKGN